MKTLGFAILATMALSACAPVPSSAPPRSLLPPPVARPPVEATYNQVTANPDAARIIEGLQNRALRPLADDVSAVEQLAPAPGYVWRLAERDYLHIHVYRSGPPAAAAAQAFVMQVMAKSQIIDWVGTPHLFQCGSAIALYLGGTSQALNVLTNLCGPPRWSGGGSTALAQPVAGTLLLTEAVAVDLIRANARIGDREADAIPRLRAVGIGCRRLWPHEYSTSDPTTVRVLQCWTAADRTATGYRVVYGTLGVDAGGQLREVATGSYPVIDANVGVDSQGRLIQRRQEGN